MRYSFSLMLLLVLINPILAQDSLQQIVQGRKNAIAQLNKPYVILISADGFRYDYADKYDAKYLLQLRKTGVQAESMIPSFPSVTYPNHYSVATGLYPSHHGLVYNQFYDRNRNATYNVADRKTVEDGTWYGGTPLWVLAEQQGMLSASYQFVGTEAAIQNVYPTYWYRYKSNNKIEQSIDIIINWLKLPEYTRPHFISFYLGEVDHAGHVFGPDAEQTKAAVHFVDEAIGLLTKKVGALNLPVNFIFLADHGMANIDTVTHINIAAMIDTARFIMRGGNTSLHLYAKDNNDILPTYDLLKKKAKGFIVYLAQDIPEKWHFNKTDDVFNRIGDIFIVPEYPKVLSTYTSRFSPGAHGFDPVLKDMHASFYTWGPQFKKGKIIPSFENVHVYPMICKLLGLTFTGDIDGKTEVLGGILR